MTDLHLTPQLILALHLDSSLTVEIPGRSQAYRRKLILTPQNAYAELMQALQSRKVEIEAERLQRAEQAAKQEKPQPNWRLIARHYGLDGTTEIREWLDGHAPTIGRTDPKLLGNKSDKSLEEMGL